MATKRALVLRDMPADDSTNYFSQLIPAGTLLTKFVGATYGCVNYDQGDAFTLAEDPTETPFAQVNYEDFMWLDE